MQLHRFAARLILFLTIQGALSTLFPLFAPLHAVASSTDPFAAEDYFNLQRVVELSLSSDGMKMAYVVESQSLQENKTIRKVYINTTEERAKPRLDAKIQAASDLAWIPETHELAFLSNNGDGPQVFSFDTETKIIRKHTNAKSSIVSFRFSPDGRSLAWVTQGNPSSRPSDLASGFKQSGFFERLRRGNEGIVVNLENAIVYQFLNPEYPDLAARPANTLWISCADTDAVPVNIPGQVKTFYWSSVSSKLSVSFVPDSIPNEAFLNHLTSFGIYSVQSMKFDLVADAHPGSETEMAQYYVGGEWMPHKDQFFIRRITERNVWRRDIEWTLFNFTAGQSLEDGKQKWRKILVYSSDGEPAFIPADQDTIYSNKTVSGRRALYQIKQTGMEGADILQSVEGSISQIKFSTDFHTAVFVNESLSRPPEIYIWRHGVGVEQKSNLNVKLSSKRMPVAREVTWYSDDGTAVHGWLIEPIAKKASKPWPLLTFVHGGPGIAYTDTFAMYFGYWPYPIELYALHGIAVFVPNYRGTKTFGNVYATPERLDGEPVDDILSGIKHLITEGIADIEGLGIFGHSHGAWLGSLVMTRAKQLQFKAASFAEGTLNKIVNYSLMPEYTNREVHDVQQGASLYDDPLHYVEISPDLHFKDVDTAVMFESGAYSLATAMMGSAKAARRAGMPTEFVVYPNSGHNLRIPRLQYESATRNLDWFRFWLQGYEDPSLERKEQYARWRKMRDERCAWDEPEDEKPSYCEYSNAVH